MTTPAYQWLTLGFLVVLVVITIAFDAIVAIAIGPQATISRVLLRFSLDHPLIVPIACLVVGVIIGHVFLPQFVR